MITFSYKFVQFFYMFCSCIFVSVNKKLMKAEKIRFLYVIPWNFCKTYGISVSYRQIFVENTNVQLTIFFRRTCLVLSNPKNLNQLGKNTQYLILATHQRSYINKVVEMGGGCRGCVPNTPVAWLAYARNNNTQTVFI